MQDNRNNYPEYPDRRYAPPYNPEDYPPYQAPYDRYEEMRRRKKQQSYDSRRKRNNGAARYLSYVERDKMRYGNYNENESLLDEVDNTEETRKGSLPTVDLSDVEREEDLYAQASENIRKHNRRYEIISKTAFTIFCTILAVVLNILSFHIPLTPSMITVEFSIFAELLVCIAVSPLAAVLTVIIKNGIWLFIHPVSMTSIPNKILLDIVFILLFYFVTDLMNNGFFAKVNEERLEEGIPEENYLLPSRFIGGIVATVITAAIAVLAFRYILLPLTYSVNHEEINNYQLIKDDYLTAYNNLINRLPFVSKIIPSLNTLIGGIILYNFPIQLFKYGVSMIAGVLISPLFEMILERKTETD